MKMERYSTVESAVELATELLEANMIAVNTDSIRKRVFSWYCNSDVTDPEILAACALMNKDWTPGATYEDMLAARDLWFPRDPYHEISVWEIEMAQHDAIWW